MKNVVCTFQSSIYHTALGLVVRSVIAMELYNTFEGCSPVFGRGRPAFKAGAENIGIRIGVQVLEITLL